MRSQENFDLDLRYTPQLIQQQNETPLLEGCIWTSRMGDKMLSWLTLNILWIACVMLHTNRSIYELMNIHACSVRSSLRLHSISVPTWLTKQLHFGYVNISEDELCIVI